VAHGVFHNSFPTCHCIPPTLSLPHYRLHVLYASSPRRTCAFRCILLPFITITLYLFLAAFIRHRLPYRPPSSTVVLFLDAWPSARRYAAAYVIYLPRHAALPANWFHMYHLYHTTSAIVSVVMRRLFDDLVRCRGQHGSIITRDMPCRHLVTRGTGHLPPRCGSLCNTPRHRTSRRGASTFYRRKGDYHLRLRTTNWHGSDLKRRLRRDAADMDLLRETTSQVCPSTACRSSGAADIMDRCPKLPLFAAAGGFYPPLRPSCPAATMPASCNEEKLRHAWRALCIWLHRLYRREPICDSTRISGS